MASLFRRGLPAIVLAGTGGVLLARFDHTEALTVGLESAPSTTTAAAPTAPSTTRPSTAAPPTPSTTRPTIGVPTAPSTTPSTTRPSTTSPPTTGSAAACSGAETLGPVVQTKWGPVQVAAVISQGRICDVRAVVVPSSHARSAAINSRAVPILRQRVLDAQNAAFDTVSGATVTSDGYRSSLQALLNAAK